jgi:hypothetical protein
MSILPEVHVFLAAGAALTLWFAALAFIFRMAPFNLNRWGILVTAALYVFLAWKDGFVRADEHTYRFLGFLPLAYGLFCLGDFMGSLGPRSRTVLTALYAGTIVMCLGAAHLQPADDGTLTQKVCAWPGRMGRNLKAMDAIILGRADSLYAVRNDPAFAQAALLPRAQAAVGNEGVEVMNYLQWAALANALNYRPRPVIQGYIAYTPYLQDVDEAYFRGPARPRYVLMCQQTIDDRFPTLDDSAALNYVLNNYAPIADDGDFLVLRQTTASDISFQLVHEQILHYGEKLDVSPWARQTLFMSVSMPPSLLGRAMALAFQLPPTNILLASGTSRRRYRFVAGMAERPFLLSPVMDTNLDIQNLYGLSPGKIADSITFERPHHQFLSFQDGFTVRLYTAPEFPRAAKEK